MNTVRITRWEIAEDDYVDIEDGPVPASGQVVVIQTKLGRERLTVREIEWDVYDTSHRRCMAIVKLGHAR